MDHVRPDLQSYRYVDRARCSREPDGIWRLDWLGRPQRAAAVYRMLDGCIAKEDTRRRGFLIQRC
jgi:hypothetical protein